MTDITRTLKRLIALGLSSSLIALSAGTEAYAAIGRNIEVSGAHAGPSAAPVAPVSLQLNSLGGLGAATGALPGAGLNTQLPALPRTAATVPNGTASLPSLGPSAAAQGPAAGAASLSQPGAAANGSAKASGSAEITPEQAAAQAAQARSAAAGGEGALDAASSSLEKAAPSKVAKTGRIASVVRSLKSVFGSKAAQDLAGTPAVPAAGMAQDVDSATAAPIPAAKLGASTSQAPPSGRSVAQGADSVPPAPPAGPNKGGNDDDGGKPTRLGFSRVITNFIAAMLVAQIGVEALAASMPTLVQKVFGDFTVVAQLAIFSSIGGIIGRQLAPAFIANFGLKKVYLTAEVIRLASITTLIGLLITGHMTLPLMMGFYSINAMLAGSAVTAESSIPRVIIGGEQAKLEKFSTWKQFLLEIVGVTAPILTGQVVAHFGFVPALVAYPLAIGASLVMLFLTLKIPNKIEAERKAELAKNQAEGKTKGVLQIFKDFGARIARGAKLVWHTPALKYSFLAYTAFLMLNPWLYSMLAAAYGLAVAGAAHAETATSIAGWLTGLYSLGGLLGAVVMIFEQRGITKKVGAEPVAPKADAPQAEQDAYAHAKADYDAKTDAILRPSMIKWMRWGTLGLAAIATLAFPSPLFFGSLTIPALALIPFGIAQVISMIKLQNFYAAKTPDNQVADANGFLGAASIAINTTGLLVLKQVFHHGAGFAPFWGVAVAMAPLALVYLWLTHKMKQVSAPAAADKK